MLTQAGCNIQQTMLYYPNTELPSPVVLAVEGIQFWPSTANDYRGFTGTAPINAPRGTIIVFHGNAGSAADRSYYVHALSPLGYRVILAEYPGYGTRKGKLSEGSFVNDARETILLASELYQGPLYLLGESLGCGVAAAAAKDSPVPTQGMMLITPWDTLLSVAREKFPWLPVRFLLKDAYDTVGNLKGYHGRIAIVGAERDEVIPIQHAQALFASLPAGQRMFTIKGAGHNDWLDVVSPAWWKELVEYIAGRDT